MTDSLLNASHQADDSADLNNDPHYLRAVSELADKQEVVSSGAIYNDSGIKLIDKGVKVDQRLYERLMQHRLVSPIDEHLTTSNAVDIAQLKALVVQLSESHVLGRQLLKHMGGKMAAFHEPLQHMTWPAQASFKMTVMREQQPELFEHSVLMMMVSVYLATKSDLTLRDRADVAAAALLHDVGMLYMPPSWADPKHKLTDEERKHLAAHSITAMLVVRSTRAYPRTVEDAVLEHHERMDGSGYPRSLSGSLITPMGRILMLAEVVSAFYTNYTDMPAQRLSLMLRMNHDRFCTEQVEHAYVMMETGSLEGGIHTLAEVKADLSALGTVFQHWSVCKRQFPEKWQTLPGGRAGVYINARLVALEKSLAEAGSHPRQQVDWLRMFEEDPSSMTELVLINREALWQIDSCIHTCLRRWPHLHAPNNDFDHALSVFLKNSRASLGHVGKAPAAMAVGAADAAPALAGETVPVAAVAEPTDSTPDAVQE